MSILYLLQASSISLPISQNLLCKSLRFLSPLDLGVVPQEVRLFALVEINEVQTICLAQLAYDFPVSVLRHNDLVEVDLF